MKKISIILLISFFSQNAFCQILDKKISIKLKTFKDQELPPFIHNINLSTNGDLNLFYIQRFRGKAETGTPLTYSNQLKKNFFETNIEKIEYFPLITNSKFDNNLNAVAETSEFYFPPRKNLSTPTFIKIPINTKSLYPEDLALKGSMEDIEKWHPEFNITPNRYFDLVSQNKGVINVKDAKLVSFSKVSTLQPQSNGTYLPMILPIQNEFQDPKLIGLLAKEEKSFQLSDDRYVQFSVMNDESDNYTFYKNNVFVIFDKTGKVIDLSKQYQPYLTKFIKTLKVYDEKGAPSGIIYLFSSDQMAIGKAPRNPISNEFYFYYFDTDGSLKINKKFAYGDNPKKDDGFKPIFAIKTTEGIKMMNANGFGFSKKGAYFEKLLIDFQGNLKNLGQYEAESYKSKFSNRADFITIDEIVFQDGKYYNIFKSISPGFENMQGKTLGLGLSVINKDLIVEFNGEILNHTPTESTSGLETVNLEGNNYIIYNNLNFGSFIVDLKKYNSPFKVGTFNTSFSFFGLGKNFVVNKNNKEAFFIFPETDKSVIIQKVKF